MKYKKEVGKSKYKDKKESLIKKFNEIKNIKENKQNTKKLALNGVLFLCSSLSLFLIYKGPIKKQFKISLVSSIFVPMMTFFCINLAIRSYVNNYYFKSIAKSALK